MKIQSSDWKHEKHVPVIEVERKGENLLVSVEVGKEIAHPNLPEHHIKWIEVYFETESGQVFPLGRAVFEGHGEQGYTNPSAAFLFKPKAEKGRIRALSFCNIHGVWENVKQIE